MPFVEANGLTFHVQELGDGPPVAMVHGMFLGNMASWYFSIAPMLATEHRVFLYDLRGHGRSDRPATGYDLATQTADLHALAAGLGDGPLDLVGHSYGGLVALRFALEHPRRVRRLVVVEAPMPPRQAVEARAMLDLRAENLPEVTSPEEVRAAIERQGYDAEAVLGKMLPARTKESLFGSGRRRRSLFRSLHSLVKETSIQADVRAEPDFTGRLSAIRSPALCIYGETSGLRPAGERLAQALPGGTLKILAGGHYVTVERPRELGAAIREFLDG